MGKSFSKDNWNYSESNSKTNSYKRRKNQIKEEHSREDLDDYKIHGFKKSKFKNS